MCVCSAVVTSCVRLGFLPALLGNPDTSWAMGIPMDWSVVEPAVGIFVSSVPAITGIRHLWGSKIYGYGSHGSSALKSQAHIRLQEFKNPEGVSNATVSANKRKDDDNSLQKDNDSEEHLVRDKSRGISRTTEFQLSYEPR